MGKVIYNIAMFIALAGWAFSGVCAVLQLAGVSLPFSISIYEGPQSGN